jgi:hypothetical protein
MTKRKIFQIGFNKCGTSSLHALFAHHVNPPVLAMHWDDGTLAKAILDGMRLGTRLLPEKYDEYTFFSDMECVFKSAGKMECFFAFKHFAELDRQYPGSRFILNTKDADAWVRSRMRHRFSTLLDEDGNVEKCDYSYAEQVLHWLNASGRNLSKDNLGAFWKKERKQHHAKVLTYFKNRPDDLLVFDFDTDPFSKFTAFFSDFEFTVDCMPVVNKTDKEDVEPA